jgi:hypothetical protein
LDKVGIFPWKFVDVRPDTTSAIQRFLYRHADAVIIDPDIVGATVDSSKAI